MIAVSTVDEPTPVPEPLLLRTTVVPMACICTWIPRAAGGGFVMTRLNEGCVIHRTWPGVEPCTYLSTACDHAQVQPAILAHLHEECATEGRRWDGTLKVAATCKWCGSPCLCPCHTRKAGP